MLKTVVQLLFVAALGLCVAGEGYAVDAETAYEPCEVQPVSVKSSAGDERPVSLQLAGTLPPKPVPILSWHCGTPDPGPPDIVIASVILETHRPRAPPRRALPTAPSLNLHSVEGIPMKKMLIIAALLATVAATASDAAAHDDEPQAPRGMLKVSPR